jgi:KaiC/GvpD/RAD55 family RecA-like ATPase
MALTFQKATKRQAKLRLALIGPAGSGKTYTALSIARHLGSRVAVIDTERGSASKYADLFAFDRLELQSFSPETYVEAIRAAERAGYDVLIIDSLSHAWTGKDGALEQVDKRRGSGSDASSFNAWRNVTPLHNAMVDAIITARLHVIATMRVKTEYVMEEYTDNGRKKTRPVKVGLQPIQRDGLEYEFDVIGDLDVENNLAIGKTRVPQLHGQVYRRAGREVAEILRTWLDAGEAVAAPPPRSETPDTDALRAALKSDPTPPDAARHGPTGGPSPTPQRAAVEIERPLGEAEWQQRHHAVNAEILAAAKALGIAPLRLQQRLAEKYQTDGTLNSLDYEAKREVLSRLIDEKAKREESRAKEVA